VIGSELLGILLVILLGVLLLINDIPYAVVWLLAGTVVLELLVLFVILRYFKEQNEMLETAQKKINEYLSGNHEVRLECDEEGELYKLFHKVNSLAAVLNAHAENELHSKEFLKHTISDISHQLKTPLAALNIYNGIMQDETMDPADFKKFTTLTEQELDRIETLVQNLLKITKLDSGTIALDRSVEPLFKIMEDVKKHFLIRTQQEGKQITLEGETQITLFCDKDWITQALDNIVKNAIDHTEEGGLIQIKWRQLAALVQVIIIDNGSGIHPEDMHYIFKRFYRSRFSKDTQGLGLGLPLAKSIIELHSGNIEVDSELGRGTTFTINFLIPTEL